MLISWHGVQSSRRSLVCVYAVWHKWNTSCMECSPQKSFLIWPTSWLNLAQIFEDSFASPEARRKENSLRPFRQVLQGTKCRHKKLWLCWLPRTFKLYTTDKHFSELKAPLLFSYYCSLYMHSFLYSVMVFGKTSPHSILKSWNWC